MLYKSCPLRSRSGPWVAVLAAISFIYIIVVALHWGEDYIDFGDGNYLYISSRLADGLVLYRDIMAPQPPCHLYLGSLLVRIGRAVGNPLYIIRAFSLLLHLATMIVIFLITKKIAHRVFDAFFAALFYLIIPIGFWWSQGYQSEGLLIFFLLISFYFFIHLKPKQMIWAAVFGTLAAFTNMTAVPYLFLANLFLLVRKRRLMLHYTLPMAILGIIGVIFMEFATDHTYLQNVFLNQVGTFPKPEISGESVQSYAFRKIINEGGDILNREAGYVLFGLAGLILYLIQGEPGEGRREYIGWYAFFSFCSIIYVSKGGTMDYIFTIGEPFAAIFFAYLLGRFWIGPLDEGRVVKEFPFKDTTCFAALSVLAMLIIANFYIGFFFIQKTLRGDNYELPQSEVLVVKDIIKSHTKPDDPILAPPFYAVITGRHVIEEYSENYIWTIKYINEVVIDKKPGEGVGKALAIAKALREKRVPLVMLDLAQTAKLPPIKEAIDACYVPLNYRGDSNILQTLNTRIAFYVPKIDGGKK